MMLSNLLACQQYSATSLYPNDQLGEWIVPDLELCHNIPLEARVVLQLSVLSVSVLQLLSLLPWPSVVPLLQSSVGLIAQGVRTHPYPTILHR